MMSAYRETSFFLNPGVFLPTAMFDDMSDSRSPPKTPVRCQKPPEPVLPKKPVTPDVTPPTATTSDTLTPCSSSVPTPAKVAGSDAGGEATSQTVPLEVTKDLRDLKDITHDLDKMDDLGAALSPGKCPPVLWRGRNRKVCGICFAILEHFGL